MTMCLKVLKTIASHLKIIVKCQKLQTVFKYFVAVTLEHCCCCRKNFSKIIVVNLFVDWNSLI